VLCVFGSLHFFYFVCQLVLALVDNCYYNISESIPWQPVSSLRGEICVIGPFTYNINTHQWGGRNVESTFWVIVHILGWTLSSVCVRYTQCFEEGCASIIR
jgi:hypothetical protein